MLVNRTLVSIGLLVLAIFAFVVSNLLFGASSAALAEHPCWRGALGIQVCPPVVTNLSNAGELAFGTGLVLLVVSAFVVWRTPRGYRAGLGGVALALLVLEWRLRAVELWLSLTLDLRLPDLVPRSLRAVWNEAPPLNGLPMALVAPPLLLAAGTLFAYLGFRQRPRASAWKG